LDLRSAALSTDPEATLNMLRVHTPLKQNRLPVVHGSGSQRRLGLFGDDPDAVCSRVVLAEILGQGDEFRGCGAGAQCRQLYGRGADDGLKARLFIDRNSDNGRPVVTGPLGLSLQRNLLIDRQYVLHPGFKGGIVLFQIYISTLSTRPPERRGEE